MGDDGLPTWMTYGRTAVCQKDPRKGNGVKPIAQTRVSRLCESFKQE